MPRAFKLLIRRLIRRMVSLSEHYRRIAKRRGSKRAAIAVAHSILVIISHLLNNQTTYQEKGETFFEEQERQVIEKR
jgi:transposase